MSLAFFMSQSSPYFDSTEGIVTLVLIVLITIIWMFFLYSFKVEIEEGNEAQTQYKRNEQA
jgi:hypothetical protein